MNIETCGFAPQEPVLGGYNVEQQVGFMLRQAHQRHTALFAAMMAEAELTPTQFNALVRIIERGSVTQNQLGRLTAMDPATIQGVIRRLVERGLVERQADPDDRRTIILTATRDGVATGAKAVQAGRAVTDATLEPLSPAERQTFLRLLRKVT